MKSSILNTHSININLYSNFLPKPILLVFLPRINRDYPVESAHERSLFTSCNAS